MSPQLTIGRDGLPECPYEIREVVEQYARQHGRTASVHFVPTAGWMARLELKPNDERVRLYQEGRAAAPPTEDVWFHEPNPLEGQVIPGTYGKGRESPFRPIDIIAQGPSWVRAFLDRGNMFSGRGETGTKSLEQVAKDTMEKDAENTRRFREAMRDENRQEVRSRRRDIQGVPVVSPGIDLKGSTEPAAAPVAPSST